MTYTIEMLRTWRNLAERRAQLVHQLGHAIADPRQFADLGLAENHLQFASLGTENQEIGDALKFSCVPTLWGKQASDAARNLLIELTRNAILHGKATKVEIHIEPHRLVIRDDGREFSHQQLLTVPEPRGGFDALSHIANVQADKLLLLWGNDGQANETIVSFLRDLDEALSVSPCAIEIGKDTFLKSHEDLGIEDCQRVYIVLRGYPSVSDVRHLIIDRWGQDKTREYVVIVKEDESSDLVVQTARDAGMHVMIV